MVSIHQSAILARSADLPLGYVCNGTFGIKTQQIGIIAQPNRCTYIM